MGLLKTKYLVSEIKFERIYRKEELEYPEEALREAIINAVIHRDYIGAHTQLKVYSDKIILWNDGGLPNEIKIEDLKKNHLSKPRNELLADIFFKAGLIETWGRGTIKITDECNNAGLPEPEFKEEFGEFAVYFLKDIYTEDMLKKTGLNERQIKAVRYIKKHGSINLSDLKKLIQGVTEKTLYRDLQGLGNKEILIEIGEKKGRKYKLSK